MRRGTCSPQKERELPLKDGSAPPWLSITPRLQAALGPSSPHWRPHLKAQAGEEAVARCLRERSCHNQEICELLFLHEGQQVGKAMRVEGEWRVSRPAAGWCSSLRMQLQVPSLLHPNSLGSAGALQSLAFKFARTEAHTVGASPPLLIVRWSMGGRLDAGVLRFLNTSLGLRAHMFVGVNVALLQSVTRMIAHGGSRGGTATAHLRAWGLQRSMQAVRPSGRTRTSAQVARKPPPRSNPGCCWHPTGACSGLHSGCFRRCRCRCRCCCSLGRRRACLLPAASGCVSVSLQPTVWQVRVPAAAMQACTRTRTRACACCRGRLGGSVVRRHHHPRSSSGLGWPPTGRTTLPWLLGAAAPLLLGAGEGRAAGPPPSCNARQDAPRSCCCCCGLPPAGAGAGAGAGRRPYCCSCEAAPACCSQQAREHWGRPGDQQQQPPRLWRGGRLLG